MAYLPDEVKNLFLQAIEITDPERRQEFLDRVCGQDWELRRRVEQLVAAHVTPDSCFASHTNQATAAADQPPGPARLTEDLLKFLEPCSEPGRLGKLGEYEIMEVIGQGGMGVVMKAYDTKLERVVAIKSLAPHLAFNAMAVKRFLREARAAAAVSHDHVVTIFAVEECSSPPFLVMECIAGQSLQQKIDRQGQLSTEEILRIAVQIADGLAAAHRQGLVHRDIKPSNILLENGVERVKITDFGLARAVDDVTMTQTGHVAGTPEYMSPEQARGEQIDVRSDLFSLGSVMYTMCTGRTAFRADSSLGVLHRVCNDTPRGIAELNPTIPDAVIAVVERLLEKDPQQRFQSAAEVAGLLAQMLAQYQSSSGRLPPVKAYRAAPRKQVWPIISALTLAVLLLAMAAWWLLPPVRVLLRPISSRQTPPLSMPRVVADPRIAVDPGPARAAAPFDKTQAETFQEVWAEHLGIPIDYHAAQDIHFRLVPPGSFPMGNDTGEINAQLRELQLNESGEFELFAARSSAPRHQVTISQPFYLSRCEITVAQFRAFVTATGYRSTLLSVNEPPFTWQDFTDVSDNTADNDVDQRPVLGVSWEDARAYCRWLSEQTGLKCDLPSEAQWEFACRAGSTTRWSFGEDAIQLPAHACCNQSDQAWPATVGGRQPNAFGLFDMHGNVDEWCLDWHKSDFYVRSPSDDPLCAEDAGDPASGRVVRGGSWLHAALWTQSASRFYDFPALPVRKHGFRVAITGDWDKLSGTATTGDELP